MDVRAATATSKATYRLGSAYKPGLFLRPSVFVKFEIATCGSLTDFTGYGPGH